MSEVNVGKWSGIEHRRHKRVALGVPIECRQGETVVQARAENLSVSGLLVRSKEEFEADTELMVSFLLPGSNAAIRSRARVAHLVPGAFMGLELLDLKAAMLQQIEQYVAASVPLVKAK